MINIIKALGRHICLFLAIILVMYLFLIICAVIPNSAIKENMISSANQYKDVDAYSFSSDGRLNSIADNYADSVLLNIAYSMGGGNPFVSVLDTKYCSGGDYGINYGLYQSVVEDVPADADYTRYWHGTAGIVRIIHTFADVTAVKLLGFILAILLAVIVACILIKSKYYAVAFAFVLSLLCIILRVPMAIMANLTAIFGGTDRYNALPGFVGLMICIFVAVTVVYMLAKKPENTSVL